MANSKNVFSRIALSAFSTYIVCISFLGFFPSSLIIIPSPCIFMSSSYGITLSHSSQSNNILHLEHLICPTRTVFPHSGHENLISIFMLQLLPCTLDNDQKYLIFLTKLFHIYRRNFFPLYR